MITTTCTIESEKWAELPPANPEERSVVLVRPERPLADLEGVPQEISDLFQAMLKQSQMAIANLNVAQREMAELPSLLDQEIEQIQKESSGKIAEAVRRAQETEAKRQEEIDLVSRTHRQALVDQAKQMTEEERIAQDKIFQVKTAIQSKKAANQSVLNGLQREIEHLGPDNQQMKSKYEKSLRELEENRQKDLSSANARLGQLNRDRQAGLANMDQKARESIAQISKELSQTRAHVGTLQGVLAQEQARAVDLTNQLGQSTQELHQCQNELNQVHAELDHQRRRRRGTRILGLRL